MSPQVDRYQHLKLDKEGQPIFSLAPDADLPDIPARDLTLNRPYSEQRQKRKDDAAEAFAGYKPCRKQGSSLFDIRRPFALHA